ncbi:putative membrane protein [Candidatus Neoehrlichia lotoris str. RAC413]|uniref:Putative membrane protein n=1 Tax=Candidatus Neoehrlichia procyonis str. RAC413 TaxID=1359163 RepID=A0A0F3NNN1_9RICK|nr:putative membrane protein [Candidatus Neoehrlichia lotoris str. RAC413]
MCEFLLSKTVYQFTLRVDFLFFAVCFFYIELLPCYLLLFVTGVIRDCIYAFPLGATPLMYTIIHFVLNNNTKRKIQKKYLIMTLLFIYGLHWMMCSIFLAVW